MKRTLPVLLLTLLALTAAGLTQVLDDLAQARQYREQGDFARAMELLQGLLESRGEDPAVLIELARTSFEQANEVLSSASPTLGQLALVDAIRWAERAAKASPDDPVPFRLLGRAATRASDFDKAIDAWRHAAELDPADGESLYQLGFALSYRGRFREGIVAFDRAEALLGPDARICLNRGISRQALGETAPAKADFLRAIEVEVAGKRLSSDPIKRSWTWLWRIHSDTGNWEGAVETFAELAERYPRLTAPFWYLAHARIELQDFAGAAEALGALNAISPTWAEGYRLRAETLTRAGLFDEAAQAAWKLDELDPGGDAARDLLLGVVRGLAGSDRRPQAMALVMTVKQAFPDDPKVIEVRGDLYFADGLMELARADYLRVLELDPYAGAARAREQKAVAALLRKGKLPEGAEARVPYEPREGGGGVIFDFESPQVFVRVNGSATGSREEKEFRLTRKEGFALSANCSVTFVPTIDTRGFAALAFEVTGPAGKVMNVRAKDCYDEFDMREGFVRLAFPEPIELTGERQTIVLPLDRFVPVIEGRPIPLNRARLRSLVFEIGRPLSPGDDLAREIRIDNVRFLAAGEGEDPEEQLVEDFNNDPEEMIFLADGTAMPFARTISRLEDVAGFEPEPSTSITPEIMGDAFDPATVQEGRGAYRVAVPAAGAASAVLTFNPDRSYDFADAIVFWAKGAVGGEQLRVTIRDAVDDDLGNDAPAQAPRMMAAGKLLEGHFVLGQEWRKFTIPRALFPDVYFDALAELRFHVGTPEGNPVGTVIYLDSIRWE